jgi:hypothetical protein
VGKAVLKLRDDLVVLHLRPTACPLPAARARSLEGWRAYAADAVAELRSSGSSSGSSSSSGSGSGSGSVVAADPDFHVVSALASSPLLGQLLTFNVCYLLGWERVLPVSGGPAVGRRAAHPARSGQVPPPSVRLPPTVQTRARERRRKRGR